MADNDRQFLGITQNECTIQGAVVGDPIIQGESSAYLVIRTSVSEIGANGQWFDNVIDVPVFLTDAKKVAVVAKYVKDGRKLLLNAYYKSFTDTSGQTGHGFFVKKMTLGPKKWVPQDDSGQFTAPPLQ
jgi:hypothetical protein